jgi:predicted AAA+ superfamily ATPase
MTLGGTMRDISRQQVLSRISLENPWHNPPHKIPKMMQEWTPRSYLDLFYPLIKRSKPRRAVVLMGPRRVGKTVLIHHAIQKLINEGVEPSRIYYFSVDHPLYSGQDLEQLIALCSEQKGTDFMKDECYVFFDEIQYLKGWELYLKAIVDRYPNIKCIASGSAAAALRLRTSQSGAGRFTEFLLPPLTFHEYLVLLKEKELTSEIDKGYRRRTQFVAPLKIIKRVNEKFLHYINFGGYPEVIFSPEIQADPARFLKSDIIDKVLLRDLPSLYGIQDIQELNYLFTTLAFNTANEVSLDQLSSKSGLAKNTIKKYIEYLEAAFLIKTVNRVDINARRFRRAHFFKVYLSNPSIRSALFSPIDGQDEAIGYLVETAIFAQWFHSAVTLHFARWRTGEIDIVHLDEKTLKPRWIVEAKWSDAPYDDNRKLNNIIRFSHLHNLQKALVTTRTKSGIKSIESVDIELTPASVYCYILGRNIIESKGRLRPAEGD